MSLFITFEGIEGVGKSTQVKKLEQYLKDKGYGVVSTLEPGATKVGKKLRELILDPNTNFKDPYTEALLFYADRMEHIAHVIKPALQENKIVLSDRYIDSTSAYQVFARRLCKTFITQLNERVSLLPDITILFDDDPNSSLLRAKNRAALDRFEIETIKFHKRVREGYLEQARLYPDRIKVISVESLTIQEVFEKVLQKLDSCSTWKHKVELNKNLK